MLNLGIFRLRRFLGSAKSQRSTLRDCTSTSSMYASMRLSSRTPA